MAEKKYFLHCDTCGLETLIKFQIPENDTAGNDQTIQKKVNCEHCPEFWILTIPSNWDYHPLVLGDDDFLGYRQGIPIIRGKKP